MGRFEPPRRLLPLRITLILLLLLVVQHSLILHLGPLVELLVLEQLVVLSLDGVDLGFKLFVEVEVNLPLIKAPQNLNAQLRILTELRLKDPLRLLTANLLPHGPVTVGDAPGSPRLVVAELRAILADRRYCSRGFVGVAGVPGARHGFKGLGAAGHDRHLKRRATNRLHHSPGIHAATALYSSHATIGALSAAALGIALVHLFLHGLVGGGVLVVLQHVINLLPPLVDIHELRISCTGLL